MKLALSIAFFTLSYLKIGACCHMDIAFVIDSEQPSGRCEVNCTKGSGGHELEFQLTRAMGRNQREKALIVCDLLWFFYQPSPSFQNLTFKYFCINCYFNKWNWEIQNTLKRFEHLEFYYKLRWLVLWCVSSTGTQICTVIKMHPLSIVQIIYRLLLQENTTMKVSLVTHWTG